MINKYLSQNIKLKIDEMKKVFMEGKFLLLIVFALICITSCTKYPDPAVVNESYGTDSIGIAQRKVLVISIDGVTGAEMQKIAPPNIAVLQQHGKYTYNVHLDPDVSTDASTWATLLNGNFYAHHLISDSSFQLDLNTNGEFEGAIPYYPDFFTFIKQGVGNYKTALISPWNQLVNNFPDADFGYAVSNDAAVKDSAINILGREKALGAMVLDFNEAEMAGLAGSFSASDDGYKAAILNVDGYVGDIMTALKARPTYSKENWLVIVTTDHGGSSANPKPGFVIYSNPSLSEQEVKKVGLSSIHFGAADINAIIPNDNGLYDYGIDKDFTVQMHVKFNGNAYYPQFLGKCSALNVSNLTGWFWMQEGDHWNIEVGGSANGGSGKQQFANNATITDGSWHTLTMTMKYVNSTTRTVTGYTDGVQTSTGNVSNTKSISTPELFRLGAGRGGTTDFYAADLEIFDVALDSSSIVNNLCLQDITQHPAYLNLTGYWPGDDALGGIIANKAPGGYDMQVEGNYKWDILGSNVPCSMATPADITLANPSVLSLNTDVAANVLYWLQIKQNDVGASFDGSDWLDNFEKEIYGL